MSVVKGTLDQTVTGKMRYLKLAIGVYIETRHVWPTNLHKRNHCHYIYTHDYKDLITVVAREGMILRL